VKKINVYDFDATVYNGDSTVDFWLFELKYRPKLLLLVPYQCFSALLCMLGFIKKGAFKERFFCFLKSVPNIENDVIRFWNTHYGKMAAGYLRQKNESDVIISASPEFLLRPACEKLGIRGLIATRVNPLTGKFLSANCYGEEKAARFKAQYPAGTVDNFYSDSFSDAPMARLAERSFLGKKAIAVLKI
jgi:phosphoserine phosphatase